MLQAGVAGLGGRRNHCRLGPLSSGGCGLAGIIRARRSHLMHIDKGWRSLPHLLPGSDVEAAIIHLTAQGSFPLSGAGPAVAFEMREIAWFMTGATWWLTGAESITCQRGFLESGNRLLGRSSSRFPTVEQPRGDSPRGSMNSCRVSSDEFTSTPAAVRRRLHRIAETAGRCRFSN